MQTQLQYLSPFHSRWLHIGFYLSSQPHHISGFIFPWTSVILSKGSVLFCDCAPITRVKITGWFLRKKLYEIAHKWGHAKLAWWFKSLLANGTQACTLHCKPGTRTPVHDTSVLFQTLHRSWVPTLFIFLCTGWKQGFCVQFQKKAVRVFWVPLTGWHFGEKDSHQGRAAEPWIQLPCTTSSPRRGAGMWGKVVTRQEANIWTDLPVT